MTFICVSNWLSGLARFISDRAFLLEQPSSRCLLVTTIRRARSLVSWVAGGVLLENAVARVSKKLWEGFSPTSVRPSTAISMIECWMALSTGSLFVETRNSEAAKRDSRKGDDIKIWVGNEKKKATCVRFLFVQPGVVSTCNVTERISFVKNFAAVFRKGVLEFF